MVVIRPDLEEGQILEELAINDGDGWELLDSVQGTGLRYWARFHAKLHAAQEPEKRKGK
jgi:hypothetical protein